MPEITTNEVLEAVNALRKEVETGRPDLDKIDRIEKDLEKQEKANQDLVKLVEEQKTAMEEADKRYAALEADVARASKKSGVNYKETDEYKAFDKFIIKGLMEMERSEVKTLRSDVDVAGGYLAPVEMDNEIIKKITEISDIRSIARVRSISAKALDIAKRNTIPVAQYEGQLEDGTNSESSYTNETLTPYRQTFSTAISLDLLMDAAFDMEAEILSDASEAFAKGEGQGFVLGSGHKEPEGFLTNAEILANLRNSNASGAGTIDADDVILLTGDLKVGYDPVYVFNRRTLAFLRTLKATDGNFLWQPGLNGPVANTLNGFPYLLADDMPDLAGDSLSVAFGDFRRGYTITDRTGLAVIRDELTLKKKGAIEFTMNRWNTGQVVLAEAIKVLKSTAP